MKWGAVLALIVIFISASSAYAEDLVKVEGKEADELVRIVVNSLNSMDSFALKIKKVRTSEFFEPVTMVSDVYWKKPMHVKWIESNPETKKMEAVSVLSPDKYIHYVKVLNTVEILKINKHKDVKKKFKEYTELINGGYKAVSKKYSFIVFRVKNGNKKEKVQTNKDPVDNKKETAADKKETPKPKESLKTEKENPLAAWQKMCSEFKTAYGRSTSEYRIKFKPQTKEMKKEIIHINFVIHDGTIISKIIIAKADGEIISSEVLKLSEINKDIPEKTFIFEIPPKAEVKYLLEDK